MKVEHLLAVNNRVGECPIWAPEEQALYWVDIPNHRLFHFHPATRKQEVFDVGLPVGSFAFRSSGGLLMATKKGFAFWDAQSQEFSFIADPEADKPHARFNDGAVDRQGRFWAGTLNEDDPEAPESCLYRLDPDLSVHTLETGVKVSNGIGWSPDDRIMYFTDSRRRVIYAYDYDPPTGTIENRRPFVSTPDGEGFPDGLTVDYEGYVWSAHYGGWKVTRYDPDGEIECVIHLPVQYPTSCAFGGTDLNELYITSAWTRLSERERKDQPFAGDLFRVRTETKGLNEEKFAG